MAVQPHVLNWLYSVLTSEYHDVNRTYNDVSQALSQVPSLSPRTDVHTFPNGASALLLHLSGTLPAVFRGATYRYPISVWVPHAYPREAPLVYVTPTENMMVRPGQHVDPQGLVYHPYLAGWAEYWDKSTIVDFLTILRDVFSKEPPVISRPSPRGPPPQHHHHQQPPPVTPTPTHTLPQELASSPHPPRPPTVATATPPPAQPPAPPPKGSAPGAVPQPHHSSPAASGPHTPSPPPVPPHPRPQTTLNALRTVSGTVSPPSPQLPPVPPHPQPSAVAAAGYRSDSSSWADPGMSGLGAAGPSTPPRNAADASAARPWSPQALNRPPYQQSPLGQPPMMSPASLPPAYPPYRQQNPPLSAAPYDDPYARQQQQQQQSPPLPPPGQLQQQQRQPVQSSPPPWQPPRGPDATAAAYLSYSQQQPQQQPQQQYQQYTYAQPPRPRMPPPPDIMDAPDPAATSPPPGQRTAPGYHSPAPSPGLAQNEQQQQQQQSHGGGAGAGPEAAAAAAAAAGAGPPPVPPNPEKDALLHQLARALAARRQQSRAQDAATVAGLQAQGAALRAAADRLQQDMSALAQLSALLTANTEMLHETLAAADAVVASSTARPPPAADELLVGPTVVANQLYDLVAEERALADALFVLGRAVERGRIAPVVFAKMTRSLAREWYLKKALVRKVARGMGLATV